VRTLLAMLPAILLLPGIAGADDAGMPDGASRGYGDIDGRVRYQNHTPANDRGLKIGLGHDSINKGSFYLRLAHPLPLQPHAGIGNASFDGTASGRLPRTPDYGGSRFTVGEDVDSTLQLQQSDIILYYSIQDTAASVDVGVNARYIDSNTAPGGAGDNMETANVAGWIPMLYAGIGIDLPLPGLSLGADGSFAGYQGNRLHDVSLYASYTTPWRAGVDLGYRHRNLGLDAFDAITDDVEFRGTYAGIFLNF